MEIDTIMKLYKFVLKKKNISDVLELTVNQAVMFFEKVPIIYRKLKALENVGLGYIRLGQSATTFSGGEAQRIKLATELSKKKQVELYTFLMNQQLDYILLTSKF